MARTGVTDVQDILGESDLAPEALSSHIQAASFVVDDIEARGDLPAARLELIERYVAAHFATTQEPRITRESMGSGTWEYQLDSSYAATAERLDPTGVISGQATKPTAGIHVPDGRHRGSTTHTNGGNG